MARVRILQFFTRLCFLLGGCDADPDPAVDDPVAVLDPLHPDARCGDGHLHAGEDCDEGDANGQSGCTIDCRFDEDRERRQPADSVDGDCGNGQLDDGEVCDEGTHANVWQPGACAPDCSARITAREIRSSDRLTSGDLGEEPVARADAACRPGYRAVFSDGVARLPPHRDALNGRDWVLEPYTAYVRPSGELIWTTGAEALLGVRGGVATPLQAPLLDCGPAQCPVVLTGLSQHWDPLDQQDCHGWTTSDPAARTTLGDGGTRDTFLRSQRERPCDFEGLDVRLYCVQR